MKSIVRVFLLAFSCFPLFLSAQPEIPNNNAQQMLNKTSHNFFIENKGQWPGEVRYLARIGGMNAWITKTGVVYDYYQRTRNYKPEEVKKLHPFEKEEFIWQHSGIKGQVVNMQLEGVNPQAKSFPSGMQEGYYNYFLGNDSTKWASFVRLYNEVLVQEVYPGIDIRYYFDNGLIRYDYIAKPGANLEQINLKIIGSDGYSINEKGELILKTCLGNLTHGKLYAYQTIENKKIEVACSFSKNIDRSVGMIAQNYNHSLSLVIDPLVYSTYLGGSVSDYGGSIVIDSSGNACITGSTNSTNFPTTSGAYDRSYNGGINFGGDAYVTKLNADGTALIYSTFIGGSNNEGGNSIVLDSSGNALIIGSTSSTNFPTTSSAYQISGGGSYYDAFVIKINSSGTALLYSTYIGGSRDDGGGSIAIDNSGNAYITGWTGSSNFPTTTGVFQTTYSGSGDIFVTKINSSGSSLIFSTYIGGINDEESYDIAIDSNTNAYITGYTYSTNYPTTSGAYQTSGGGSKEDVIVTKLNSSGTALIYSTYIGGNSYDEAYSIALDSSGNAYITGAVGPNYPTTTGAFQRNFHNGGGLDAFVTKLNSSGTALVYSTYLGADGSDRGTSIAIDKSGNAYITGTGSPNYPTTLGAYLTTNINTGYEVFVTKINSSGTALDYSTFIGGQGNHQPSSIVIDGSGNVYITGTSYTNYPTTIGAYQTSLVWGGYEDAFITKILLINQSTNINISNLTKTSVTCSWTNGNSTKRAVFIKQATAGIAFPINDNTYTAKDTFGSGSQIGTTGWYCVYNDTGSSVNIYGLTKGTNYRVMVCDYVGSAGKETYNTDSVSNNPLTLNTIYDHPTIQDSNLTFSNVTSSSFSVNCTKGNGLKRVMFIKSASSGKPVPVDNITYTANNNFGSGSQVGSSGWYCIYNDTGITVTINNLSENTIYRVMVCEYNGTTGNERYDVDSVYRNPENQITDYAIPTTQAYNLIIPGTKMSSINASWANGDGVKRVVFIKSGNSGTASPTKQTSYNANDTIGKGSQIGATGWFCVYNGTGSGCSIYGLYPDSFYRLMVCEYNGTSGRESYNISTTTNNPFNYYPIPTIQTQAINFTNITGTGFTININKGSGTKRAVFIKSGNTGTAHPANYENYSVDSWYGYGEQIGSSGWYCVFNDTGRTETIGNLTPNTIYRIMVCEYNGSSGNEQYNIDSVAGNPVNQITEYLFPSTQASNLNLTGITTNSFNISWTNGNGTQRVVFIKSGNSGSASPSNYTTYYANDTFGQGSQIGTTGWYCVYNGTSNGCSIYGLTPNTTYVVMVCEFNGISGREIYNSNTASNNPLNCYLIPNIQAQAINFSNITTTSFLINSTKGNGTKRAIFIKVDSNGIAVPVNNTTYTANSNFNSGSQIGSSGWYCVYNDTGRAVSISTLKAYITYRVMVCEYNGTSGREQYNTDSVSGNPANQRTALATPVIQAYNLILSGISKRNISVIWTNGEGFKRIVFIKSGISGNAGPINNTTYNANDSFGKGSQLGTSGWFCVYNGTGNGCNIYGLIPDTIYRVMVCEYNGPAGWELYNSNIATNNPLNYDPIPNIQAQSINFSNITATGFSIICIKGNGKKRAIFIKSASIGIAFPGNNITYTANTTFGSGTQIGSSGWYCVYNDTGRIVSISNLTQNTIYRVMVCEYNGTTGREQYNLDSVSGNPVNQITDYTIPTIQAKNLILSGTSKRNFNAVWANGNGSSRVVFIKPGNSGSVTLTKFDTYNANDSFGKGSQIGTTGWYCVYNGTGNGCSIFGLTPDMTYVVMVCEYNGTAGRENYIYNTASANPLNYYPIPTKQADSIKFSNITATGFSINCVKGNGIKRAIYVKSGSTGIAVPRNNSGYMANTSFGLGPQIGTTGWYCVYNDTGRSVTVSNLTTRTIYRAMVCEYNGTTSREQFNFDSVSGNPANQITDYAMPTIQARSLILSAISKSNLSVSWTNGTGTNRVVFIKSGNTGSISLTNNITYNADDTFGKGDQIGTTGWYCVYNGTSNGCSIYGLTPDTTYRVMVCEYNGTSGSEKYIYYSYINNPLNYDPIPNIQAHSINFSNIGGTGFSINCIKGNGTKRAIFIKSDTIGIAFPENNKTYTANTTFGSGSQIGSSGWYCVYNDTGSTVSISNLSQLTIYRVMVSEYNGTTGRQQYNVDSVSGNPANQMTNFIVPSIQAKTLKLSGISKTNLSVSWTNGNGTQRVVFIKSGNTGSASPSNYTTYYANDTFGQGSQIGTSGWYCVYNGTSNGCSIYGLTPSTTYVVMVCEYNGTSGKESYNSNYASFNPLNYDPIPTIQAHSVNFSNNTGNRFSVNCSIGNGPKRAIFIKSDSTGFAVPVNNTTYNASVAFGNGSQIGNSGWYCAYYGTGNSVNIQGLTPNKLYRIMVCEYNGLNGRQQYNIDSASGNPSNQLTNFVAPLTVAYNLSFTQLSTTSLNASWVNGGGTNRVVFIKSGNTGTASPMSDSTYNAIDTFGRGNQIGSSGWYCVYNGTGSTCNIYGLTPDTTYRVMVCEYNGTPGRERYNTITLNNIQNYYPMPSKQADALNFSNITANGISVSCIKGSGTKRAIFIKSDSTGNAVPVYKTTYSANTTFGSGTQIGSSGWYCVYNDTGRTVSISNLNQNTNFRVMVCEYNGISGSEKYNIDSVSGNPANQVTDYEIPTTQASNLILSGISKTSLSASWTNGNGTKRVVFIKSGKSGSASPIKYTTYNANETFGIGNQFGTTGWYCVYNGTGNGCNVYGLTPDSTYRIVICEYNGTTGRESYNNNTASNNPLNYDPIPNLPAHSINFSYITATSFSVSCIKGSGIKRAIFIKSASTGIAIPGNSTTYTANTNFGSGSQIGISGWYCVYNDTGRTVSISNLSQNTIYRVMVCEYNGISGKEQYNIDSVSGNPANQITDYELPTIQASNLILSGISKTSLGASWTNGNGTKRVVFIKSGNSGSASPTKYITYNANDTFGRGSLIGTTDWYCVYNGSGNGCNVYGLTPDTTYRIVVCEYNGTTGRESYNNNTATNNPLNYDPIPNTQARDINFSNITATGFSVSCIKGSGIKRAIFIKLANTGIAIPGNNSTFTANTNFGSGTQIGSSGWYCVYNDTGRTVSISNLSQNTIYRVMVCEYNGISGREQYNSDSLSGNPANQITDYEIPTTQTSNLILSGISKTSLSASWTNGNGTKRVVFIKSGNSGSASPINSTYYNANDSFGKGNQIGTSGWYCVYNGTGNGCSINGLTPDNTYRFKICEYNGTTGRESYNNNTATNNPLNYDPIPNTQARDINFSNITAIGFSVSCIKGSGIKRAIFIKSASTGIAIPGNNTTYTANTNFGSGSQIGSSGWYCVYNDTGRTVSISNLSQNTIYRVMVCEYNGISGREQYNPDSLSGNPANQITDYEIPTTQAHNLILSGTSKSSFSASWTNGNGTKRVVYIKSGNSGSVSPTKYTTYNANDTFGKGNQIGTTGWYSVYNGTGNGCSINGLTPDTTYQVMVCEYNGTASRENYNNNSTTNNPLNYDPIPVTQAKSINFSNYSSNCMTTSWTNGNGSSRVVFVSTGSSGTVSPSNNTKYQQDTTFGLGTQNGSTGWYCVYNGTGNKVSLSGLTANTTYRVMVCEYNGASFHEQYNTDTSTVNPRNYYPIPVTQAYNILFNSITAYTMNIKWSNGNGSKRAVFVCSRDTGRVMPLNYNTYTSDTVFGSGKQVGTSGWYCVYNGTGNTVAITGLSANTAYRVMICEYNGTAGEETYNRSIATNNPSNQTTDYEAPTIQSNDIGFTNVTSNSFKASWTNGNGTYRVVFIKTATSGTALPVNNITYTPDTFYSHGSQINGWYCVFKGTASSVNISNLSPNTNYRLMVYDYNGTTGYEKYNTNVATNNPNNQTTDFAIPLSQANGISFSNVTATSFSTSWTNGNGTSRAVFIKAGIIMGLALPVNNLTYTADTILGSGSQIDTSKWYCVYNGTGNSVSISNLMPNTSYRLMVCEYNGTSGFEKYNTNSASNNPGNQTTDYSIPSIQATGINFSNITFNSFSTSWTNGNGTSRAVFIKAGTIMGSAVPVNNHTYTDDSILGSGSQIGTSGWYCVYNGTGNSVSISNLMPNTAYRLMVCEYNGTSGFEKYNTNSATNNPNNQTTDYIMPDAQAFNITFSSVTDKSFTASWTKGNGSSRAVFINASDTGTASPSTNTSYIANTSYSTGSQIGSTGWYCVYNDTGSKVSISNLMSNTIYRIMVCEYNGTAGAEKYNTSISTNNPAYQTTDFSKPTFQASNIIFSNLTSSSADINYTRGNGTACLVLITEGTTPYPPLQDNTNYTVSSQVGTSGWFCKYNGIANSANLTGLHPANFRMMVCEYNGTTGFEKYNTDSAIKNPNSLTLVGINDYRPEKITIYPNPFTQSTTISFSNVNKRQYNLKVYNLSGKLVRNIQNINESYVIVTKGDLSAGLYYFELIGNEIFKGRFIIEK